MIIDEFKFFNTNWLIFDEHHLVSIIYKQNLFHYNLLGYLFFTYLTALTISPLPDKILYYLSTLRASDP